MGGFRLRSEVDMESLLGEECCCSLGESGGELEYADTSLSSESWLWFSPWLGFWLDIWSEVFSSDNYCGSCCDCDGAD